MQFPVMFHAFGRDIHPHAVMEALAYVAALGIHAIVRRRAKTGPPKPPPDVRLWLFAGVAVGGLAGAKILQIFEVMFVHTPAAGPVTLEGWLGGKTVVGGMIGAWIATEIVKKVHGIKASTGDLWVFPLIAAVAIGRIGCFLTGLPDQTFGVFTTLPWAVDFGDGPRHPTQLYEIAFVLAWALPCALLARRWSFAGGKLFRFFMLGYMTFRFLVEFIKPSPKSYLGLSAIQLAAASTALYCAWWLWKHRFTTDPQMTQMAQNP